MGTTSVSRRQRHHTLAVTEDDIDYLRAVCPMVEDHYSCNDRLIWPTDGYGYSNPHERRVLENPIPVLREAQRLVLNHDWRGGRFHVNLKQGKLILCKDGSTLANLHTQTGDFR